VFDRFPVFRVIVRFPLRLFFAVVIGALYAAAEVLHRLEEMCEVSGNYLGEAQKQDMKATRRAITRHNAKERMKDTVVRDIERMP